MKKLLLFIFLLAAHNSYAQAMIDCNIRVEVPDSIFGKYSGWVGDKNGMRITQHLKLPARQQDSITLTVHNMTPLDYINPSFYFKELKVYLESENGDLTSVEYIFDSQNLKFQWPAKGGKFKVSYIYSNDAFDGDPFPVTSAYLLPYIYNWHSWYFNLAGMIISECVIHHPEQYMVYSNQPLIRHAGKVVIVPEIHDYGINLYLVNPAYYRHTGIRKRNTALTCFQTYGAKYNEDSTDLVINKILPDKSIKKRTKNMRRLLNRLTKFFPTDEPLDILVIDGDLRRGNSVWGNTSKFGIGKYLILIDTSMWRNNSICHEMIHVLDNNILGNVSRNDSTYYFFAESLIEYLSNYFFWEDKSERNNNYLSYGLHMLNKDYKIKTIWKLNGNRTADGSADIIYFRTPYVLHCYALRIGEDKFISILHDFYSFSKIKGETTLDDFRRINFKHRIKQQDWDFLMKNL